MVTVRDATRGDAEAVCAVHGASIRGLGPAAYDEEQVAAWAAGRDPDNYPVDADDSRFLVAERDDRVVGFGEVRPEPGEHLTDPPAGTGEVLAVYVHPEVAGEGVGSTLLAELESTARDWERSGLGLRASLNAVPFYDTRGYERVTEHDHEFGDTGVPGTVVEMYREL